MNKEIVSDKQGRALMVLFIIGESLILVSGLTAEKDLWLAIILAMVMILPLMYIYGYVFNIFLGRDLYDIVEIFFGKFIGKGMILLYTLYAFDLVTLILRDFSQFINIVSFSETPIIIPMISIMILCAWGAKNGIEVIGRWGEFFLIIISSLVFIAIILLIPNMNLDHIRPVLYNGIKPVIKGAYEVFIYPFGETVIFMAAFSHLKNKKSIYKIYGQSVLIGGIFLLGMSLTIVLVLGTNAASRLYFPAYTAVSRINVRDFIQRIEIIAAIVFILGGFIKMSIYLLAICKGVAKIFGCRDYRFIIIPISLLVINQAYLGFDSIMSFNTYIFDVWIYYAFIFIFIFPIIIWIVVKIKKETIDTKI